MIQQDSVDQQLYDCFRQLKQRQDVARLLGVSDKRLCYILYVLPEDRRYESFRIPKRTDDASYRQILAPTGALKVIQRRLNRILSIIYQPKPSTHGFVTSRSIVTNARAHLGRPCVLNIDLKDFFPSINFGRVRGLFLSKPYECTEEVATILAQICCHQNQLPQGAPTSPLISNMICGKLDSELQRLAKKYHCFYTRYADDITFSTSRRRIHSDLAYFLENSGKVGLGSELQETIHRNGFQINELKVKLRTKHRRQEVTGLVVNEKLNVKRQYIRHVRSLLHMWEKYGLESAQARCFKQEDQPRKGKNLDQVVRSKIEFLGYVRGFDDPIYLKFLETLQRLAPELISPRKMKLFIQNNYSKDLILNFNPTILTEGKTDLKHLLAALNALQERGEFTGLKLDFPEIPSERQGYPNLIKRMQYHSDTHTGQPLIGIFDRDLKPSELENVHSDVVGFKDWGNGVYSFALPIPSHRQGIEDLCIEHYYRDDEITRKDNNGRRIFLAKEFHPKSSRHLTEKYLSTNEQIDRFQNKPYKIIDDKVFDSEDRNVALSKNDFSENIFHRKPGFDNFDFTSFSEIFKVIEKIIFHYSKRYS